MGGETWQEYAGALTDQKKVALFSDINSSFYIPLKNGVRSCDCMLRISITAMKYNVPEGTPETEKFNYWNSNYVTGRERYCDPNLYSIFLSSVTDRIQLEIEYYKGNGQKYSTVSTYDGLAGYSGRNNLRGFAITFGGAITQPTNMWNYRFIFRTQAPDGSFNDSKLSTVSTSVMQSILGIQAFSNNCWSYSNMMMYNNHIYTYDYQRNASFPAAVVPYSDNNNLLGNPSRRWSTVYSYHGDFSGTLNATTIKENGTPLENKYVQLDYSDGNAVAFFNPQGQSPAYIKAGLNGIVPYTSADNWESSSGYVGAHAARFATSYIKDMYAKDITADSQISAALFVENGTSLSKKYALKSELPSTKQILTAYTGSENIGFASTANTQTTKVITLNTTLQENDIVRVYVSGTGAYASQNAGVITFEVAKGANNTKLMGSGSTFTATGGTSGIIFANVNLTPNQLVCGTYALTDSAYATASVCDVFKVTIERNTN